LTPKGRIVAELRALMLERELIWVLTEQADAVLSNFTMYKIGRSVEVERREASVSSLVGPRARAAVPVELPQTEHSLARGELGGASAVFVATDVGVDVVRDGDQTTPARALGVEAVSPAAAELVRIESGRPRHGFDMSEENLPAELGLERRAVSFTKGCYVGQEPVARMHYKGHPNRHLRGLRLQEPAEAGQPLRLDGKEVGTITSAAVSPALGPIALALVRREVEPGTRVEVDGRGESTVVELPFER
jgi:folate-binding protein YgfZ